MVHSFFYSIYFNIKPIIIQRFICISIPLHYCSVISWWVIKPQDNRFFSFIWYTFTFKWKSDTTTRFKSNKRRLSNFPNYTTKENIIHANNIFNRPDHTWNVFILFVYSNCSCKRYNQKWKCYSYSLQDTLHLYKYVLDLRLLRVV